MTIGHRILPGLALGALLTCLPMIALHAQGYRYLDLGAHCNEPRPRLEKTGPRDSLLEADELPVIQQGYRLPTLPRSLEGGPKQATTLIFVVDSTGKIDRCSVMVVQESSALWSWAVSRVLPGYHYRPGMLRGKPVALWVQQTIRFPAGRQSESDMLHLRRPY